jgi:hypothetical protein
MQSFKTHAHRPLLTGVGYVLAMIALVSFVQRWRAGGGESVGLVALCGAVLVLLQISRRYTTKLQDRIIKLEMRVRTASLLTPEQQQRFYGQLNNKQVAALRFASDAELPALAERAVRDKLPPKEIKRAVQTWVPDFDRT